jgi:hypothetical protein
LVNYARRPTSARRVFASPTVRIRSREEIDRDLLQQRAQFMSSVLVEMAKKRLAAAVADMQELELALVEATEMAEQARIVMLEAAVDLERALRLRADS